MKITFIEPTPSPNTMKLHLDESLEPGIRRTYTPESRRSAPSWAQDMLEIPGVTSIYHAADFAALERKGSADWAAILREVQNRFGADGLAADFSLEDENAGAHFGEAQVFVQMFRAIPIQIRVKTGAKEERIALSSRFTQAVTDVASAVLIKERKLTDYGVRYGEPPDIAREVEQELEAAYPQERLDSLVQQAIAHGAAGEFVEQRHKKSRPSCCGTCMMRTGAYATPRWRIWRRASSSCRSCARRCTTPSCISADWRSCTLATSARQGRWSCSMRRCRTAPPPSGAPPATHCPTSATRQRRR